VHAVDAVTDHVAYGLAEGVGRRLVFTGAHNGKLSGNAPCSRQQDVPGPAGDVGHTQGQQGLLTVRLLELVGDQVVQRVFDQRLNQFVGRVVRAGGGTFIAGLEGELDVVVDLDEGWLELKQAFVHRAELLNVQ